MEKPSPLAPSSPLWRISLAAELEADGTKEALMLLKFDDAGFTGFLLSL